MKAKRALLFLLLGVALAIALPAVPVLGAPEAPAGTQIVNGDFEAGGAGWIEYSSRGYYPVILPDWGPISLPPDIVPHSGYYAAWLGSYDLEVTYIEQQVTVTAATPLLGSWNLVRSSEHTCDLDFGRVLVGGAEMAAFGLARAARTAGTNAPSTSACSPGRPSGCS